jgi:hypothetical protein
MLESSTPKMQFAQQTASETMSVVRHHHLAIRLLIAI